MERSNLSIIKIPWSEKEENGAETMSEEIIGYIYEEIHLFIP